MRTLEDWKAMTPEERKQTLHNELMKPKTIPVITLDEYKFAMELADFVCPVGRNPAGCDGNSCIRRPDPCERCRVKYQLKKARKEEGEESVYYHGETEWKFVSISEDIFEEITEPCQDCEVKLGQMEEPTYYEICMQARGARVKMWQIHQGNMEVWNNGLR